MTLSFKVTKFWWTACTWIWMERNWNSEEETEDADYKKWAHYSFLKKQAGDVIKIVAFSFWLGLFLDLLSLLFHFCFFSLWNGNYLMFLWVVNGFWWVKFWSFWQRIWVDQQSWWVRTEQIGGRRMAGAQGTTVQESLNGKLFFLLVKGWAGPGLTDRIVSFWAIFFF